MADVGDDGPATRTAPQSGYNSSFAWEVPLLVGPVVGLSIYTLVSYFSPRESWYGFTGAIAFPCLLGGIVYATLAAYLSFLDEKKPPFLRAYKGLLTVGGAVVVLALLGVVLVGIVEAVRWVWSLFGG